MPPKMVRGRKKANDTVKQAKTQNVAGDTNSDIHDPNSVVELSKIKSLEKSNDVISLKQPNGNANDDLKDSHKENGEKLSESGDDPHSLAGNKQLAKEIENNAAEEKNVEVESVEKELKNKDSTLDSKFVVPSKRGRKRANAPADNVDLSTETGSDVEKDLDDKKKAPARRGRKKADVPLVAAEASENDKEGENVPEIVADSMQRGSSDVADEEIKSNDNIDDVSKSNPVPSKRGRKKANIPLENEEKVEIKSATVENESNLPVASKRGRKKADNNADVAKPVEKESSKISSEVNDQDNADTETVSDKSDSVAKVPSKRGRKKANILLKAAEEGVDEPMSDTKIQGTKEAEKSNKTDEDLKKTEDQEDVSEEKMDFKEPKRRGRNAKPENKDTIQPKEPNAGRKRTNDTNSANEENKKLKGDHNAVTRETKTLKVALKRSKEIDKMVEEVTDTKEVVEKVVELTKNTKPRGKRAKNDDSEESKDSETKPAKVSKTEPKSKGQSKKDKMPDVTLLDFSNESTSPSGKAWNLKLSSWNVNGIRAWLEKDGLVYIKHEDPDIMCFQETKCSEKQLPDEVNVKGYHSYWLAGDKDGYSGVGLLTKEKPVSVKYGIGIEEHDNEGRVITAEYEKFFLVTAYVPNSGRGLIRLDYRMKWDKDFKAFLSSLDEKKPVVLCGDLNVAHEEIDLANPKSNKKTAGFTNEEREGFSILLKDGSFTDSFRHLYPDQKVYTYWTYMMNARAKNVGWRLDYFVLSQRFTEHLCDNVIRKDVFGSDHCPITLFLSV